MKRSFANIFWNRLVRPVVLCLCASLALCLAGCSADVEELTDRQSAADGVFRIYYTNPDANALVRRDYQPASEDFEGRLKEILDAFCRPNATDVRSALPEQVKINSFVTLINEIDIDFSAEYLSLDTVTELLLRSALVRTLVPIPGVDAVRFTVDSQNLVIGEEEIGPMNEDTFIVPEGKGINSYRNAELTLYFPAGDGTTIMGESRKGYYSSNLSMERHVVEEMLKGPNNESLYPVALKDTLVQDVTVSNGYCIVDFSEDINNAPPGEVVADPETVLYAFTNAIIESCTEDRITRVRFRIGGSSDIRFRDQVNLDQVFTRNAELITPAALAESEAEPEKP